MAEQQSAGINERLGEWVRSRRKELGLTQAELADRMRERGVTIDATGITRIEKGTRTLRIDEAQTLAQSLWTTFSEIVDAVEAPPTIEADLMNALRHRREVVRAWSQLEYTRYKLAWKLSQYGANQFPADVKLADLRRALGPDSDPARLMKEGLLTGLNASDEVSRSLFGEKWHEVLLEAFEERDAQRRSVFDDRLAAPDDAYVWQEKQQLPLPLDILRVAVEQSSDGKIDFDDAE